MVRVGEDVSEKLDIVPAEFFVHRHIYGKWACRCCQRLVQEPVEPQIIDGGLPAAGLVAHTLISRFVDHLPYYRQETITPARAYTRRAPHWLPGQGALVRHWSRSMKRTSASYLRQGFCTPTRRRWRCSTREPARPSEPTSGPIRVAPSTHNGA